MDIYRRYRNKCVEQQEISNRLNPKDNEGDFLKTFHK